MERLGTLLIPRPLQGGSEGATQGFLPMPDSTDDGELGQDARRQVGGCFG